MQSNLVGFFQMLREHDLPVSPAESLDAMQVAATLGYGNRDRLRDGLGMALAKTADEEAVFQRCFDHYFQRQLAGDSPTDPSATAAGDGILTAKGNPQDRAGALQQVAADSAEIAALLDTELLQNLQWNDRAGLSLAISRAAEAVGLAEIELFTQKGQYTRRMLEQLGEGQIRRGIVELEQRQGPALAELRRYRDRLRELVRDHVDREYLLRSAGRHRQLKEEILRRARLSHIEQRYIGEVQGLVRKMARRLASRHARKRRRNRRGSLDMQRTLRGGLAHDGVLFTTYWRRVRREKSQILAVCDVSRSVAAYAKFLLLFLYSLQDVLPRVRSFAFSNHLGEVSDLFQQYPVEQAVELINWRYGGGTDYGGSFADFARLALDEINSNTTFIILGDARNNHGDPRLDLLRSISARARRVIWLNPESRRAWGTGDSEMLRYQSACHFSAECNNLDQLQRIVDQLLKSTD